MGETEEEKAIREAQRARRDRRLLLERAFRRADEATFALLEAGTQRREDEGLAAAADAGGAFKDQISALLAQAQREEAEHGR